MHSLHPTGSKILIFPAGGLAFGAFALPFTLGV
jgi:hypothetical protein